MDTWDKPKELTEEFHFLHCVIFFLYFKDIKSLVEISNHCLFKTLWPCKIKWLSRQDNVSTHKRHLWQTYNLLWCGFCFSCLFKAASSSDWLPTNHPVELWMTLLATTWPFWRISPPYISVVLSIQRKGSGSPHCLRCLHSSLLVPPTTQSTRCVHGPRHYVTVQANLALICV